jgi:serine/threonine-protein kinase
VKAPELPEDAPTVGDGRWVPLTVLGEGGQCQVLAAWDTRLRMGRALKILLPEHACKSKRRARFLQEARAQQRLEHPHIVKVHEIFDEGPLPWLVMDLVEGGSLQDWVDVHGPMPPAMAVAAALDIAEALTVVHDAGMVHRDVKPANLLMHKSGRCKLADFGIARDPEAGLTRTGAGMGTLGFVAPEQLQDAKTSDARSDVFSLAASVAALVLQPQVHEQIGLGSDSDVLQALPEPLQQPLRAGLQLDPDLRPATMADFARSLRAALDQLPVPVGAPDAVVPLDLERPLDAEVVREIFDARMPEVPLSAPLFDVDPTPPMARRAAALADDDELPDYAVQVAPRDDALPIDPTPPAPPPPPPPSPLPRLLGGLAALALLALFAFAGLTVRAARTIDAHAHAHAQARDDLVHRFDADHVVVDELASLGFDVGSARSALEPWRSDPSPESALIAIDALEQAAQPLLRAYPERPDAVQARQRLDRLLTGRDALRDSRHAWEHASGGLFGGLSTTLGLAEGP